MMKGAGIALNLLAVGLLSIAGNACAQSTDNVSRQGGTVLVLNRKNAGQQVVAIVGQKITITLGTVGPGNYGVPQLSAPEIQFEEDHVIPPFLPSGPTQLYTFRAISEGQAEMRIPHVNSGPVTPVDPFVVTVQVKAASTSTKASPHK